MNPDKELKALACYRFEQSLECLQSARVLAGCNDYRGAANRSYYAFFHAMRSVFALYNKDFSKHSGVAANFRKDFIKNGAFDVVFSDMIKSAFYIRNNSDYDDFYVISKSDVQEQIKNAEVFCAAVRDFLEQNGVELQNNCANEK